MCGTSDDQGKILVVRLVGRHRHGPIALEPRRFPLGIRM